jgi:hypothetical protein
MIYKIAERSPSTRRLKVDPSDQALYSLFDEFFTWKRKILDRLPEEDRKAVKDCISRMDTQLKVVKKIKSRSSKQIWTDNLMTRISECAEFAGGAKFEELSNILRGRVSGMKGEERENMIVCRDALKTAIAEMMHRVINETDKVSQGDHFTKFLDYFKSANLHIVSPSLTEACNSVYESYLKWSGSGDKNVGKHNISSVSWDISGSMLNSMKCRVNPRLLGIPEGFEYGPVPSHPEFTVSDKGKVEVVLMTKEAIEVMLQTTFKLLRSMNGVGVYIYEQKAEDPKQKKFFRLSTNLDVGGRSREANPIYELLVRSLEFKYEDRVRPSGFNISPEASQLSHYIKRSPSEMKEAYLQLQGIGFKEIGKFFTLAPYIPEDSVTPSLASIARYASGFVKKKESNRPRFEDGNVFIGDDIVSKTTAAQRFVLSSGMSDVECSKIDSIVTNANRNSALYVVIAEGCATADDEKTAFDALTIKKEPKSSRRDR